MLARGFPLAPRQTPEWDRGDAAALRAFLAGPAGSKLMEIMRYQEQSVNASAVMRRDRFEYACGYAAGFRTAFAWIHSLSANVPPQEDTQTNQIPQGAQELIETLAP